jgi:DNA-binding NarL/FixJ family response regulator
MAIEGRLGSNPTRSVLEGKQIAILLADDHPVVRSGLRALLEAEPRMTIRGEASDGRAAVSMARKLEPDIAILDISMPELNGIEATRQIRRACPQTEVIILTMHDSDSLISEALEAGVRGFVLKSDAATELLSAVHAVCAKKSFISSGVAASVIDRSLAHARHPQKTPSMRGRLTPREREIVQLIAEGKTNKEVAQALNIAVKTVETHRCQ